MPAATGLDIAGSAHHISATPTITLLSTLEGLHQAMLNRAVYALLTCFVLTATPAAAEQTRAPALSATPVQVETVASGLDQPWGLQFLPDGRFLITEKSGQLRIVTADGKISAPLANVPKVLYAGQGGLLDVRLAPDFASSKELFLSYSEAREGIKNGTTVASAKLDLSEDGGGALQDVRVIFRQKPAIASNIHFGSRLVFARDGTLFITTGDRGITRDQAQDVTGHVGKVIRINRDGSVPADNPKKENWKPEIWSIGHRNLQGATIHPETGKLWTIEHGARGGDELNHPEPGNNYGWPKITYGRDYSYLPIGEGQKKAGLQQPVYYWDPSIAPSGLMIYNGDLFAGWKGNYFIGALAGQHLARLVLKDGQVVGEEKLLTNLGERIRDVREGPKGAIWVLTDDTDGKLLKVTPKG